MKLLTQVLSFVADSSSIGFASFTLAVATGAGTLAVHWKCHDFSLRKKASNYSPHVIVVLKFSHQKAELYPPKVLCCLVPHVRQGSSTNSWPGMSWISSGQCLSSSVDKYANKHFSFIEYFGFSDKALGFPPGPISNSNASAADKFKTDRITARYIKVCIYIYIYTSKL